MGVAEFICGPEWDRRIVSLRPARRVGLLVSGGLDSTVLYYMLSQIEGIDLKLYNLQIDRGLSTAQHVKNAIGNAEIEVIPQRTLTIKVEPLSSMLHLAALFIQNQGEVDTLYTAANMIPPLSLFPEFDDVKDFPSRSWSFHDHDFMEGPFLPLYKYHIIDAAIKLNVPIQHTHTCCENKWGQCDICWACKERVWGFNQLGIEPINTKITN